MNRFCVDVRRGLSAGNKYLSSKYFYDEEGSKIFQEIMQMPEYYLTDAEHEILLEKQLNAEKSLTEARQKLASFCGNAFAASSCPGRKSYADFKS